MIIEKKEFFAVLLSIVGLLVFSLIPAPTAANFFARGEHYFAGDDTYDLERARSYYEEALKRDPELPAAWHQLARLDFLEGNFSEALAEINKQIELHGTTVAGSYYVRGLIHGYRKEFAAAEQNFLTYKELHPNSWGVYNDLAWIYFQQGKYERAAEVAKQGLALRPNNAWLLTSYGMALSNLGKKEEARPILEKALREAKKLSPEAWSRNNPGNDPRIAAEGLAQMTAIIEGNLHTLP